MWTVLFKERIPLVSYILLAAGLAASGIALNSVAFAGLPFLASSIGLLAFFIVLRIMDEYKDSEKDMIAHPDRPLPRGVLSEAEVLLGVYLSLVFMLGYALINFLMFGTMAGVGYLLIGIYLWLMFREFYVGPWLDSRPVLYAFSHQLILILCCLYAFSVAEPESMPEPALWSFSAMVLGAFFTYEICRKLDPNAHPVLKTYLQHYGPAKTCGLIVLTTAIAAFGALRLELLTYLGPIYTLLLASLSVVFVAPGRFKLVEIVASISLIAHIWILPTRYLFVSGVLS